MRKVVFVGLIIGLFLIGLIGSAQAGPTFYLYSGKDVTGDNAFKTAVNGLTFYENDFDAYNNGSAIDFLNAGKVVADISLPNLGSDAAEIFWGSYTGAAGGTYGTVVGGALLNENRPGGYTGASEGVTFSFSGSEVVRGFGIWVFDNSSNSIDNFSMTVRDLYGNEWTSNIIDANPGSSAHTVEGFLGVVLSSGLQSVTINHAPNHVAAFELDHMQIASSVPEPATMLLFGLGLVGMATIRRTLQNQVSPSEAWHKC